MWFLVDFVDMKLSQGLGIFTNVCLFAQITTLDFIQRRYKKFHSLLNKGTKKRRCYLKCSALQSLGRIRK